MWFFLHFEARISCARKIPLNLSSPLNSLNSLNHRTRTVAWAHQFVKLRGHTI